MDAGISDHAAEVDNDVEGPCELGFLTQTTQIGLVFITRSLAGGDLEMDSSMNGLGTRDYLPAGVPDWIWRWGILSESSRCLAGCLDFVPIHT